MGKCDDRCVCVCVCVSVCESACACVCVRAYRTFGFFKDIVIQPFPSSHTLSTPSVSPPFLLSYTSIPPFASLPQIPPPTISYIFSYSPTHAISKFSPIPPLLPLFTHSIPHLQTSPCTSLAFTFPLLHPPSSRPWSPLLPSTSFLRDVRK